MTAIEEEFIKTWLDFATALRMKEGFNEEQYEDLLMLFNDLAEEWADLDHLPRKTMNILVDVFPVMESNANLYSGDVKEQITRAAFTLHELVQQFHFEESPPPPPILSTKQSPETIDALGANIAAMGFSPAEFSHFRFATHLMAIIRNETDLPKTKATFSCLKELPKYEHERPYVCNGTLPFDQEGHRTNIEFDVINDVPVTDLRGLKEIPKIDCEDFQPFHHPSLVDIRLGDETLQKYLEENCQDDQSTAWGRNGYLLWLSSKSRGTTYIGDSQL